MAKRMRGLYKQKKSSVWWCCYKSLSGRVVRQSTGKTDYNDAVDFLMERKAQVKLGNEPELKKVVDHTFGELCDKYLTTYAARQRCFKSKAPLISQLKERFGHMRLRDFNTLLLEEYQTERLRRRKKVPKVDAQPAGNKPATINRLIACIKHMFTKAVDWEMVEEATLKRVHKVKFLEESNRRLRYLSTEEYQGLLAECSPHLKPIVVMAVNTGMRKDEILSLRWDQVDLRNGFILVAHTKNGNRKEIPINGTLRATLQNLVRRLDVPYVFYDPETGKRYRDVKRGFRAACRRAKIEDFRFHDLRHTFASHSIMGGVDLTTLSKLLGHTSIKMTMRYAHLAPAHMVKAVNILDNALNGNSTSYLVHTAVGGRVNDAL